MAPPPEMTGYIVVSLASNDDDIPVRDPEDVAKEIIDARIGGIVSARPVFNSGFGGYVSYGMEFVA